MTNINYEYNNGISYQIISSKSLSEGNYDRGLYIALIAKHYYIKDENFSRVLYVNLNLMSAYNNLQNFKKSYELSFKQLKTLRAFGGNKKLIDLTYLHYETACLGLGLFEDVINYIDSSISINANDICCYYIAKKSKSLGINYQDIENKINGSKKESRIRVFYLLEDYYKIKDKNILVELKNTYNISDAIIYILKDYNFFDSFIYKYLCKKDKKCPFFFFS